MLNPITAVTAADPYPFYAALVEQRPLYFDRELKVWVASGYELVESVFKNPACRVRPIGEPVPAFLHDTAAGEIFRHLLRMTDGGGHCSLKAAISKTLDETDFSRIKGESTRQADFLYEELKRDENFEWVSDFAFHLPVHTLGGLLGLSPDERRETERLLGLFVRCLAPGSTAGQIESGIAAARPLIDIFERAGERPGNIFADLLSNLAQAGIARGEIAIYNTIGLFFQSYEATAGLIGNSLAALAARPEYLDIIKRAPPRLEALINEVERFDPPVQNTRRTAAVDTLIGRQNVKAGETILLVTAAANRDPAANIRPDIFDPERTESRSLTFGAGAHSCPGRKLAVCIAGAGLSKLIFSGLDFASACKNLIYRDSANTRIPLFKGAI